MPVLNRLSPAEAAGWRERLERTARPCGCKSGALMSLAALVAWPVWIATSAAPRTLAGLAQSLVAYAFVVLAAGVIGKLSGIAVGRQVHGRVRRQLARRLSEVVRADV